MNPEAQLRHFTFTQAEEEKEKKKSKSRQAEKSRKTYPNGYKREEKSKTPAGGRPARMQAGSERLEHKEKF